MHGIHSFGDNKSPMPPNAVTESGHDGSAKLTMAQRQQIIRLNKYDIELYKFASELHKRTIARLQHWQQRNTEAFEAAQRTGSNRRDVTVV